MSRVILDNQEWNCAVLIRKRKIFVSITSEGHIYPSPDNNIFGITIADDVYDRHGYKPRFIDVVTYGRVVVEDDGYCKPGDRCDCYNGKAVPGALWKVVSRASNNTVIIELT